MDSIILQGRWLADAETNSHKLTGLWTFASEETEGEHFTLVCRESANPQDTDYWRGGIFEGFFMMDGEAIEEKDVHINFEFDHTIESYILSGYGKNTCGAFQLNGTAKSNIFEFEGQGTVRLEKVYLNEEDTHDDKKKSKSEPKKKNKNRRSKRKKRPTANAASSRTKIAVRNTSSSHVKKSRSSQSHNVAPIKNEDQQDIIEILDDDDDNVVVKCEEQDGDTVMMIEGWLQYAIPFFDPVKHRIERRAYAEKLIKSGYDTIEALENYLDEKILNELNFKPAHRKALLRNTSQE